jgi:hypothetical protein
MKARTIAYIASRGHSGSTLLDLLLSGHSEGVSVGEARFGPRFATSKCACTLDVWDCPFWKRVDAKLRERELSLRELDIWTDSKSTFVRDNVAFYDTIAELTGKPFIVDSSKHPERLAALLACGALDVRPIHLIRRPHGVVFSYMRKGRGSWLKQSISYTRRVTAINSVLRGKPHQVVRYEDLATSPVENVRRLTEGLGLQFEPEQMNWATQNRERHDCGGNRMRFNGDNTIRISESWKTGLTRLQKAGISLVTLPAKPA